MSDNLQPGAYRDWADNVYFEDGEPVSEKIIRVTKQDERRYTERRERDIGVHEKAERYDDLLKRVASVVEFLLGVRKTAIAIDAKETMSFIDGSLHAYLTLLGAGDCPCRSCAKLHGNTYSNVLAEALAAEPHND